jgi:hypothetical protein
MEPGPLSVIHGYVVKEVLPTFLDYLFGGTFLPFKSPDPGGFDAELE